MKSVLISIHQKWCELIASGKKTIDVRKTAPKQVPVNRSRCAMWRNFYETIKK